MYKYNPNLLIRKVDDRYEVYDSLTGDIYAFSMRNVRLAAQYIVWQHMAPEEQDLYLKAIER